jgi:DNA replication protein DnaC
MGKVSVLNPLTQREEIDIEGCSCTAKEKRIARLNQAGIPNRYLDASFQVPIHLKELTDQRKLYAQILQKFEKFCERAESMLSLGSEPHDSFFLLLYGPVGSGKTFLSAALLKRLIMRTNCSGKMIEFQQLLFSLRNCYSEGRSEEEILGPLRNTDILVIDELGKARTENEWQMERLDDLINWRYNAGKVTILTTNFKPLSATAYNPLSYGMRNPPASEGFWTQSLADRLGLRIYDRIMEVSEVVSFDGLPSLRRLLSQKALQIARQSDPVSFCVKEDGETLER